MKLSLKSALKISALSALAIAPVLMSVTGASAQTAPTKGTDATWVGAGVVTGVTNNGGAGDDGDFGGNFSGRVPIHNTPLSARGTVIYKNNSSAIAPKLTYDVGVAQNTNLFGGVGYNFVQTDNASTTPLGDKDAVVLTVGAESTLRNNIVLYGSADVGIDAYQNSNRTAVGLQVGVGAKF
jgi:hypothetical protein